jgi:asparagine synthase (glutamine-hydrolysing)
MCGIAGWCHGAPDQETLRRMTLALRHRGPEDLGAFADEVTSLGHARLSIIDVEGGQQPLYNEDETICVVVNGEIYNHVALRELLEAKGHRFRTHSDCETLVHLYEEEGVAGLERLNGQYAFALWDARAQQLVLCRDRVGICPLHYTFDGATLYFASEVKSLLQAPGVSPRMDVVTLGSVWTYWSPAPGRTMFAGVHAFPPASYAVFRPGDRTLAPVSYWSLDYTERAWTEDAALAELEALLDDAVALRLKADVPVGAYLSGGIDSSVLTALARRHARTLHTFSISFDAPDYDESAWQRIVADALGVEHHTLRCDQDVLAGTLPAMVRHTEAPQLRAGPLSMLLLSQSVNDHRFKVVTTGEGADELFMGYDIFRETRVRRFMARNPGSAMRRRLIRHLYTYLSNRDALQRGFELMFQQGLDRVDDPLFSHDLRWSKTARLQSYFTPEARAQFDAATLDHDLRSQLPDGFEAWDWAGKAQALEIMTFMTPYLLGSQGDRVAMANAVEGRFPFLDHRVIEFANSLPISLKLRTLSQDKYLLRRLATSRLPESVVHRPKMPYRAPIRDIVRSHQGAYIDDALAPDTLREVGLFNVEAARKLYEKVRGDDAVSEMDEMALLGIITTQLWHDTFIRPATTRDMTNQPSVVAAFD